ncbi:hypothetical protein A2165_04225 [Candidatus Curtissbacteria bacterium RBG_13_40_7]|uniref:Pilus assembly protein PilO n=1 Tax=Candidatus Curtissbacteria bacterium RBG_13_40_7 TaxID=1797706 RepID=A0A1F5FUA7_9BACT|nr:MAG: hypothetical protein A2165_04225 [Candidatus Curtissbacteria bacterium RBG_13_40_7]
MQLPAISAIKESSVEFTRLTTLAIPVGSIIVSLIILVMVVWPKFSEVLRLRTDNDILFNRAEKMTAKVQQLKGLDKIQLEQQLGAAEQLLPSDKGVFTLVGQIQNSANTSGVLLSRIEVAPGSIDEDSDQKPNTAPSAGSKDVTSASAYRIQLKVSLGGDYKSFLQFLTNMLSSSRVLTIGDLSVSSSASSSESSSQIRVNLSFDAYWKPLPKQLASIESEIVELTPSQVALLANVAPTGYISQPTVPDVLKGRDDLFTPF